MDEFKLIKGKEIDLVFVKYRESDLSRGYVPYYVFNIVLHDTNIIVGFCDARIGFNENTYYGGNVGYFIESEYRGNSYAGMAVMLLKEVFLKHQINEIIITNNPDNKQSIRVCEKLGANFIELAELPLDNEQRVQEGEIFKNIWKLKF